MFCSQCGNDVGDGAHFCCACGSRLSPAIAAAGQIEPTDSPTVDQIIDRVRAAMDSGDLFSHRAFTSVVAMLHGSGLQTTTREWCTLVDFAGDQFSRWHVRWLFSPASAPDVPAEEEQRRWRILFDSAVTALASDMPQAARDCREVCNLRAMKYILQARQHYNDGRPMRELESAATSYIAHRLNAVGFRRSAERAMNRSLFPSGTVGASQ